jgi:hypothetical protein
MNEQLDNTGMVEKSYKDINSQDVNLDPFIDTVSVDPSLTHEASRSETDVHETPKEEKVVREMPMGETIVHETPIDVTSSHETPVGETIVHEKLLSETIAPEAPVVANVVPSASLLSREESELLRTRWNGIQSKFVDEPHSAVEQADALVTEVIQHITQMIANEHSSLESQWKQGNDVSTEDLRKALQHYRSFFNRLVV